MVSGTSASLLSTLALAVCGRIEQGSAAAPNSAPSQWIWGEVAGYQRRPSARRTATGYVIHHAMSILWAAFHERCFGARAPERPLAGRLAAGAITAALACVADYGIAPRRLRPGFEKHLGRGSLLAVYGAFAVGLVLPDLVRAARFRSRPAPRRR